MDFASDRGDTRVGHERGQRTSSLVGPIRREKSGTLTGKVAAVQWTNPHVVLALDVESDGKTERWMIEGYPPNTLRRQGWDQGTLREGNRITVSGWHARDATLKIFSGREVTFENGSTRVFGGGPSDLWQCRSGDCPTAKWIPTIVK